MLKIIEVTYNYPCEVFISRHINAVKSAGCQVELVARHAESKYSESASVAEMSSVKINPQIAPQFDHLSMGNKVKSLWYLLDSCSHTSIRYPLRDRVMLGYFSQLKPDLIHFHFGSLAGTMNWIPRELGIPYTLSLRGSDVQVVPLVSTLRRNQLSEGINYAAGVHTVCNDLWALAKSYVDRPVLQKTIYTTVPIPNKPFTFLNNHQKQERLKFVAIGRLHWRKSFENLLLAFKTLIDPGLPAHLSIIGDGPERESLVYWIHVLGLESHVSLLGKLTPAEIAVQMEMSNGFIQSSIAEGFSNATAEALAMGLPVFATNVGGTNEIIIDGVNGFLLDPFQPQTWFEKLQLVSDFELMKKISENAWLTANKYFSAKKHASDFIDFYSKVLRV